VAQHRPPLHPAYACEQVGSVNNTFGISGVAEHCHFFKSIEDAHRLRARITECFEHAALPNTSEEVGQGDAAHVPLFWFR
jgi:NADH dehydrogenase FAD-containing subunit